VRNAVDVSVADVEHDGDLDLVLARSDGPNVLLLNRGDGFFSDATPSVIAGGPAGTRVATWADVNDDRHPDLYLAGVADHRMLLNDGRGGFRDVTSGLPDHTGVAAAATWGDYDGDLDLDLYLACSDGPNQLYRNDGGATFANVTAVPIDDERPSRAASWVDIDNDGDLDLYVVNTGLNGVYENDGHGTFTAVTVSGLDDAGDGVDAAWTDQDGDGDLDLYLVNVDGGNSLLQNRVDTTRWLQVDLVGQTSNASGIGARILLEAGGTTQIRDVRATRGNATTAEFGLGAATAIERVEVRWPSGTIKVLRDVTINQRLEIGEGSLEPLPGPLGVSLGQNFPNPFNPSTFIRYSVPVTAPARLDVYDVHGKHVRRLVDGVRGPGIYEVEWDGRNEDGEGMASGVYFYRFEALGDVQRNKMLLLK
jgi:hypothetical protein